MPNLDLLKRKIAEKPKRSPTTASSKELEKVGGESVDMDRVDQIVKKMKKKYRDEGVEFGETSGKLSELRGIIAEGKGAQLNLGTVEDLQEVKSPLVKKLGRLYLKMRKVLEPISKIASNLPQFKRLSFQLYSANMHYSARQFIALAVTGATIVFFVMLMLSSVFMIIIDMPLALKVVAIPIISFIAALFSLVVILMIPQQEAKSRGDAISIELPFALRHMATELRAGIGLYRTIQAIATAGYGALSEEFARTITEIEEGTDTKEALKHLALRTQCKALRTALMHVIRALKTGGNLSGIMSDIAEDVAFELRLKTRDFAAKMNFFGIIFIFAAIVVPVVIAVMGGIRNSPLDSGGISFKAMLPLTPEIIAVIYLVMMPMLLGLFIFYIKMAQPKV
ncbi:MAG: type II secretion system F family protein [archaeon]|jgi:flagellar protein FlaJ|nr:type II secretion system F family protein [archaeon]